MDNKLASIMFMPVCTKCLKIIWNTVDAQPVPEVAGSHHLKWATTTTVISPDRCPHCGKWFESIAIPTKLPFNAQNYLD